MIRTKYKSFKIHKKHLAFFVGDVKWVLPIE